MNRLRHSALAAIAALAALLSSAAQAWQRHVLVNGQRMTLQQLRMLDAAQCTTIPNGAYWLNLQTGAWGYAGSPMRQGWLGDGCRAQQRQRSLSERGRLYSPHEIIGGRP